MSVSLMTAFRSFRCLVGKVTLLKLVFIGLLLCIVYIYLALLSSEVLHAYKSHCNGNACHRNATCLSLLDRYDCKCNVGYYGDGWTCDDLNECLLGTANCTRNSDCINTDGTYTCLCKDGFNATAGLCIEIYRPKPRNCTPVYNKQYPLCESKIKWMRSHWKSHPCYAYHGVNGSLCSVMDYFVQVEPLCPPVNGSQLQISSGKKDFLYLADINKLSLRSLLDILGRSANFEWIRNRIVSLWEDSISGLKNLRSTGKLKQGSYKRVLVFIGVLADKTWSWAANAKQGGPLGELVQWSDLLLSLYLLGHFLYSSADIKDISKSGFIVTPCKDSIGLKDFDLIYTDIHGLQLMEKRGIVVGNFRCKLRILDSFGTEARFNFMEKDLVIDSYHGFDRQTAQKLLLNPYGYGNWSVHLQQFMTLFPHSPDNSFLGFIVGNSTHPLVNMEAKEDTCLVYGKQLYMWQGKLDYLRHVGNFCDIHATVTKKTVGGARASTLKYVPAYVKNFGILQWKDVQKELLKNKIFVGLGFPFEGPAPLEAIANGAVFINPKLNPPLGRLHDFQINGRGSFFFEGKPTLRELTSQHTYLEQFVGKPHVYSIDVNNRTELQATLEEIMQLFSERKMKSYLPYEFTHEGLLERLHAYIENQDFCNESGPSWPPLSALRTVIAAPQESCKSACLKQGLLCDNSLFKQVNQESVFRQSDLKCRQFANRKSLFAPFVHVGSGNCVLQSHKLYFSCVDAAADVDIKRLCPCRDYIRGQVALCKTC